MTAEHTAGPEATPEGLCRAGSRTDNPCWRLAATLYNDYPCCDEHASLYEAGEEEDAWGSALDAINAWLRSEAVAKDHYGHLERLATNMRDDTRREYAAASARAHVARLVADQGPPESGEPVLTLEQSEELARLTIRSDSFVNARTVLEDVPAEVLGNYDRWVIVDALATAVELAAEEVNRYKAELGISE